jgi:hypothetical protein
MKYSFTESEYINPMIVADLGGWISDTADQITSVDIIGANDSNRYHSTLSTQAGGTHSVIEATDANGESFSYEYLGCTPSGLHILKTKEYGAGAGVFYGLMLVTLSLDYSLDIAPERTTKVERLVMKKIGSISLGDRYNGTVIYSWFFLTIGTSNSHTCNRSKKQRIFIW